MGLFSRGKTYPYEVAGYLTARGIEKQEKEMFSGIQTSDHTAWLLCFAAPMLAKDGLFADGFPHYQGSKYEKMERAFLKSWGEKKESTVEEQLADMLSGKCAKLLDPLYRMTRELPPEKWGAKLYRARFNERQMQKITDMTVSYKRAEAYGFPMPEGTLFAYDLCRAGNLICVAVGLEILRPAYAARYLEQVAACANRYYKSWEEYYAAYVVARPFWMWNMEQYFSMNSTIDCNVCHLLLHSPQSACARLPIGAERCALPESYYVPKDPGE